MCRRSWICVLLIAGIAGIAGVQTAGAKAQTRPAPALKVDFTRIAGSHVIGSGRYVYVYGGAYRPGSGVLIDGRDGHHTAVSEPGCPTPAAIGGTSLVFSCPIVDMGVDSGTGFVLYDIATGPSRSLSIPRFISDIDCPDLAECTYVDAVGSDWLAATESCDQHCGVLEFENLRTGSVVTDPATATTTLDLSSPTLSRKLCAPVTAPRLPPIPGEGSYLIPRGLVASDGRFQIVSSESAVDLRECGRRLNEFLTYTSRFFPPSVPANSHAVIWESKPGRLTGVFLPSLRRFKIKVPAGVDPLAAHPSLDGNNSYDLALTARTMYLSAAGGVWTAPAPR